MVSTLAVTRRLPWYRTTGSSRRYRTENCGKFAITKGLDVNINYDTHGEWNVIYSNFEARPSPHLLPAASSGGNGTLGLYRFIRNWPKARSLRDPRISSFSSGVRTTWKSSSYKSLICNMNEKLERGIADVNEAHLFEVFILHPSTSLTSITARAYTGHWYR